jgi:arginine/lysine/ornithine decarboxylase
MPGERFSEKTRAVGDFLLGMEAFDVDFPGFSHHIHGIEVKTNGAGRPFYAVYCLRE